MPGCLALTGFSSEAVDQQEVAEKWPEKPLPVWAVEVLATWHRLPEVWWNDEAFALQAAGLGLNGPAVLDQDAVAEELEVINRISVERSEWERVAGWVAGQDFERDPIDTSTLRSLVVGLSWFERDSQVVRDALAKLLAVEPVKWREVDLEFGRLLPRSVRGSRQAKEFLSGQRKSTDDVD